MLIGKARQKRSEFGMVETIEEPVGKGFYDEEVALVIAAG